ncbi:MAG TPA: TlpA disulfide reductase family protein, partial [Bacteroidia bacterium]|nr:TlpA disulfide reductase family protein [Bacteroidia bacterium]
FSLTYKDTSGNDVKLDKFKGKKIIFSFWGTWCGECLIELKQLNELKKIDMFDTEVILVSDEPIEKITRFMQRKKYPFTFLQFNRPFSEIHVNAFPTNYLINSRGEVTYSKVGAINWKDNSVISFAKENLK